MAGFAFRFHISFLNTPVDANKYTGGNISATLPECRRPTRGIRVDARDVSYRRLNRSNRQSRSRTSRDSREARSSDDQSIFTHHVCHPLSDRL